MRGLGLTMQVLVHQRAATNSLLFQIIMKKNSTVVKPAWDVLCSALALVILAVRKTKKRCKTLPDTHKLFFFLMGK